MSLVYVFLADGFEEVEGLTAVDLLRRAGADVKTVSIMGRKRITSSHQVAVESDLIFEEISEKADMLVLPGGLPGTTHLKEHEGLSELLREQYEAGRWVAAICAAPSVLGALGFLKGRKATSYPGFVDDTVCGQYVEDAVVVDGNVVTSRGLGTAIPFGLTLIELLFDKEKSEEIAHSIMYR
ncbi:MAG: DJ-1/PfpI family protein [Eubacteriales bacterium]|nr:DJ-1/PfpI family protein [Eubacteriales bacterium]